tara:strand:- start:5318 stop:6607 length:1290 start_codon:yes stop_codon:yes gene_type:complete
MSYYNSGIRSRILEPVLDIVNDRAEFRFEPDTLYRSDMRLLNLGAWIGTATTTFNAKAGVYGIIDEVIMYDGNVMLDSIRPAKGYMTFKNQLKSNRKNIGVGKIMKGHNLGFVVQATRDGETQQAFQTPQVKFGASDAAAQASTGRFTLNLSEILPLCQASEYLPTQVFKDMRLVIIFKKDTLNSLQSDANFATLTTLQNPLLAVDSIVNSAVVGQVLGSWQGVGFNAIEYDSFTDPAGTGQTSVTKRLNGLNGKFVNRVLVYRSPVDAASIVQGNVLLAGGSLRAIANIGSKVQISKNGANMFLNPISTSSETLSMCQDTWGQLNVLPSSACAGLFNAQDAVLTGNSNSVSAKGVCAQNRSSAGYFGCFIRDRITSLEMTLGRLQRPDAANLVDNDRALNKDQRVNIYAEVRKSIVLRKGGIYSIIYN